MNKLEFGITRTMRSLITTCAHCIEVGKGKRLSAGDFVYEGFKINDVRDPDYPNEPGVRFFLLKAVDTSMQLNYTHDFIAVREEVADKLNYLLSKIGGRWYTVPEGKLSHDLTNPAGVLSQLMVGTALSLLPFKNDNTFSLTMHGTQLDPGYYQIWLSDIFIFDRELRSAYGPFRMVHEDTIYLLEIRDGYVHGVRKSQGKKARNLKQDKSVVIERVKKLDRGIGR